jgi:hypothetical protein
LTTCCMETYGDACPYTITPALVTKCPLWHVVRTSSWVISEMLMHMLRAYRSGRYPECFRVDVMTLVGSSYGAHFQIPHQLKVRWGSLQGLNSGYFPTCTMGGAQPPLGWAAVSLCLVSILNGEQGSHTTWCINTQKCYET